MRSRAHIGMASRLGLVVVLVAFGCTKAMFVPDEGSGGKGGAGTGRGGLGGTGGGPAGDGGTGGGAIAGTGGGGSGGGVAGSIGTGGRGGGGGGGGGATGNAGTGGGSAGRGGSSGIAGTGGGSAGTGGGGRGGSQAGTGGAGTGGGGTGGPAGVFPTLAGQIVITELMHDVPGNDDDAEWFEIYNPSATVTYDLMNCQVRDINTSFTISAPLVLAPGTFRVLAISPLVGFTPDFVYTTAIKFDSNAGDQAGIRCNGIDIDIFAYNSTDAVDPAALGKAFSVDPRHFSATENDVRANWCLATMTYMMGAATYYGSPGQTNPQCP